MLPKSSTDSTRSCVRSRTLNRGPLGGTVNLTRIIPRCECGGLVQPHSLWLTDTKSLVITGMCVACEKRINIQLELKDLFKQCPLPDISAKKIGDMVDKEIARITGPLFNAEDLKWLHEMKIEDERRQ